MLTYENTWTFFKYAMKRIENIETEH